MLRIFALLGAILIGAAIGAGAALITAEAGKGASFESVNGWRASVIIGAPPASAEERAAAARAELMALPYLEGRAYTLDRDSEGLKLDESCIYSLEGGPINARWWSISLYRPDGRFAPNLDHASIVTSERAGEGSWNVRIAPVRGEAPLWLSSRDARRGYSLVLRAYHANRGYRAVETGLPTLTREHCLGDVPAGSGGRAP